MVYGKDVAKNGRQKDRCYNKIGFRAQNMNTIIGSIMNTKEKACIIA